LMGDDERQWVGTGLGFGPNPAYREGTSDTEDGSEGVDPTHECAACGTTTHIESAPTTEYVWCDGCERLRRFYRIDGERSDQDRKEREDV
jgi:hypothetical protein